MSTYFLVGFAYPVECIQDKLLRNPLIALQDGNQEFCQVDHCPFMKPVLSNRTGGVLYEKGSGGSLIPLLQPNENFVSTIAIPSSELPTNLGGLSVKFKKGVDPRPTQLHGFLSKSFSAGVKDPFEQVQGIGGELESTDMDKLKRVGGNVIISMPNRADAIDSSQLLRFDGFLQNAPWGGWGSKASPWRTNTAYNEPGRRGYRANLQNACAATLGRPWRIRVSSATDFCARAEITYAYNTYTYKGVRSCSYFGPSDRLPTDPSVKGWRVENSYQSVTGWGSSKRNKEGYFVTASSLKPFHDDQPHHDFDSSDPQGFSMQQHRFRDVQVGVQKVVQVRKIQVEDGVDEDGKKKYKNVYQERTFTRQWQASCNQRNLRNGENPPGFTPPVNNLSRCFYIEYQNVGDRLNCRRKVSTINCRNGNGCFTGETLVVMADGTERAIASVLPGDKVYNPVTQSSVRVLRITSGPQEREMYEITTALGRTVKATWNHPFQTPNGFFKAYQLQEGEKIMSKEGLWTPVERIEEIPLDENKVPTQVWNLTLEGPSESDPNFIRARQFIANGLATGDYAVQHANLSRINQKIRNGDIQLKLSSGGAMSFDKPLEFEWAKPR